MTLLICTATELESASLRNHLEGGRVARGRIAGHEVVCLRTGVGVVNAAHALTLFLAGEPVDAIVACGVGGAYPAADLAPGDTAWAESETYGDLGAESPEGFLDMKALGFPVVEGERPLYNTLPLDIVPGPRTARFVTVSTCTGTSAGAGRLAALWRAQVESMEGAAIVHVARLHGIPVGEVRGVSNAVGDRNRGGWMLREAAEAAQGALLQWLEEGA